MSLSQFRFDRLCPLWSLVFVLAITTSALAAPPPGKGGGKNNTSLTVTVTPESFTERDAGAIGTVTRENSDTSVALTVTLESNDETDATVQPSVQIPIGEVSAEFLVSAEDDQVKDGDQTVTILATATDHSEATVSITVVDDEGLPPIEYTASTIAGPNGTAVNWFNRLNDLGMAVGHLSSGAEQRGWLYGPQLDDTDQRGQVSLMQDCKQKDLPTVGLPLKLNQGSEERRRTSIWFVHSFRRRHSGCMRVRVRLAC